MNTEHPDITNCLKRLAAVKPSPEATQQVLDRVRQALATNRRPHATRRIIMRRITVSGGIAAAVAATVALVVLLATHSQSPLVSPAYAELTQAVQATQRAEWIHFTGKDGSETWMSFRPVRRFDKLPNKAVSAVDGTALLQYWYEPKENLLTINSLPGPPSLSSFSSGFDFLMADMKYQEHVGKYKVAKETEKRDDKILTVYVMTPVSADQPSQRLVVDPQTNRIVEVGDGGDRITLDYPPSGPQDVYAVGVPKNAKIVDNSPSAEATQIIKDVVAAASATPKALYEVSLSWLEEPPEKWDGVISAATADVLISESGTLRKDEYSILLPKNLAGDERKQYLKNLSAEMSADSLDQAEGWLERHSPQAVYIAQAGKLVFEQNQVPQPALTVFRLDKDSKLETMTYGDPNARFALLRPWYEEPEFEAIARTSLPPVDGPSGRLVGVEGDSNGATYRWYFNPARDYLCERFEASFQTTHILQEVTEYAQTPAGRWYPKRIRQTGTRGVRQIVTFRDDARAIDPKVFDPSAIKAEDLAVDLVRQAWGEFYETQRQAKDKRTATQP